MKDHPTILIDTREQRPWMFPEYVPVRLATLNAGDYALEGDTHFAIERKSLDDFIGTVFSGWDRFKRELARMTAAGFVARVIIVEADYAHTLFSMTSKGQLVPPPHNHPNISPEAVASRVAELTLMGVSVLFCGNAEGAAVQAYHLLMNRNKELQNGVIEHTS